MPAAHAGFCQRYPTFPCSTVDSFRRPEPQGNDELGVIPRSSAMLTRVEFAPKSHVYSDATGPSRHLLPCAQAVRTSPRCRARGPGVREQGDRRPRTPHRAASAPRTAIVWPGSRNIRERRWTVPFDLEATARNTSRISVRDCLRTDIGFRFMACRASADTKALPSRRD